MKIVRRKLRNGICVGRYIIITRITNEGVFARNVGEKSEYWLAENLDNFLEISNVSCEINVDLFKSLKNAVIIRQPITPSFKKLVSEKPTIIRFWAKKLGSIYVIPNFIKGVVVNKKPWIHVEIKERVYEKSSK